MRVATILVSLVLVLPFGLRAQPISEADLFGHIEILASDAFEGRKPGTTGENKTVNYIATQWAMAGLQPAAAKASWYAPVALVERIPRASHISFSADNRGRGVTLHQEEIILRSMDRSFQQSNIPVVFAGYGDSEQGRDTASVSGKLVLLPSHPPEGGDDEPSFQILKRAFARDGAIGVIAIAEDPERWSRLQRSYQRGSTALAGPENHAAMEGLISFDQFNRLAKQAGLDPDSLLDGSDAVSIVDLGLRADATVETQIMPYTSHNVIGKIPGNNPESGALLFIGHWDHFGECRTEDPLEPDRDRICNGAVDNASGISLLIETAKRLSGEDQDRDIYFLATTAEEKGLLGARAFVEHPVLALDNLVAVFNADTVALSDDGKNIAVIGLGQSPLDPAIENVAEQEGRVIDRSGKPDAFLRRQDGYVFLERGVPAYMITSAFADEDRLQAYLNGSYHDVSDEVNDSLTLTGAASDANFHVALGRYFSSTETYPGIATSGETDK